jgi:hypothetical protein
MIDNKYAMLCVKNSYLKKDSFKTIEWWLQMNKLIGFDKIVLFNNSIANDLDSLFLNVNSKQFVQIVQMQCLPNFVNKKSTYLRHIGKSMTRSMRYPFDTLAVNECYYDNLDAYNHIAVMDIDELILPRKLNTMLPLAKSTQLRNQFNPFAMKKTKR